jgi:putative ABC transport system permease protein
MARQRFASVMLSAFAAFALLLAAVGIYGVMSYVVAQSTHDIGVRVALGASHEDILGLVIGHGMELAVAGIGAGLVGAVALTRVMASLLFRVSSTDFLTFGAVALLLASVAFAAAAVPARRATTLDPMVALRDE